MRRAAGVFLRRAILVLSFPVGAVTLGCLCVFWGQPGDFVPILNAVFVEAWDEAGQ